MSEGALYSIASEGGKPQPTLHTAVRVLEEDPHFSDTKSIWFDDFLNRFMTGDPPREWTDADDLIVQLYMQRKQGIEKIGREAVCSALQLVGYRNRKNCVQEWISKIEWDQTPRIEMMLADHFGVDPTPYTLAASKNFWLSMLARIMRPGCQVDNMIVLIGKQGARKSSALRAIGGEWFAEQHESATNPKAFAEIIQGKILVEISEMDSFHRAEITSVKQTITCVSDRYRDPYAKHARDHARQCIFAGTTNREDWGNDVTGARRFWPIHVPETHIIDVEAIERNRAQYFAEAAALFKQGTPWWNMPTEDTKEKQDALYTAPAWAEPIARYLDEQLTGWTTIPQVMEHALSIPKSQWAKSIEMRVGEAMQSLGWLRSSKRINGKVTKGWSRPDDL